MGLDDRAGKGDGLISDQPGRSIGVRTADCVPLLFFDCRTHAVAAVHAGWRGTAAEVVKHAIQRLASEFAVAPENLYVAIGPCIRQCCYQVGVDVYAKFLPWFPEKTATPSVTRTLDLAEANRRQLVESKVPPGQIFDCGRCTACEPEQFVSYRREPQNPWRMLSSISRL